MKGRRREDRDGTEMALRRRDGGREERGAADREERRRRRRRGRVRQRGNKDGAARKEAEGETSQRSGT